MRRALGSTVATAAVTVLLALATPMLPSVVGTLSGAAPSTASPTGSAPELDARCSGDAAAADLTAPGRDYFAGAASGTTSHDLTEFAAAYNGIRVANCLDPLPAANFVHDECLEERLAWMAGDPSTDPASAWGHDGTARSDGLPVAGCDGNLAGGTGNTAAIVAEKWWDSLEHRASLYRPDSTGPLEDACIAFAMTHGGVPDESPSFTRASARWVEC